MMNQKIFQRLKEITPIATAHQDGEKFVFLKNEETASSLTQFAYGKFMPGECTEEHKHTTMEECFFFIKGEGTYTVNKETFFITPGCFVRIPPNTQHQLKTAGSEPLEFVYFGVAV
jgi:mannose-6-phosphate isomerase-like protein (cupin superfamily)